jgi:hypothetical protein
VLTGGIIARAVEPAAGEAHGSGHGACLNCGAAVSGAYCSNCGQAAHLHRSMVSLGHDILHGVFHFEGKIWRTIPELFLRPGRLTRRYIDGERAKFVSPMALYLFAVFLMFAVFSFTSGALLYSPQGIDLSPVRDWKENIEEQIADIDVKMATAQEQLSAPDLPAAERSALAERIADLQSSRDAMTAMISGDWRQMAEFERKQKARSQADGPKSGLNVGSSWPKLEQRLSEGIQQATDNPTLLLYKLKSSGYKFSWALVPLSLPFMWLMFFWRRDIHLYDHAVFVTYSLSFMMLLLILASLLAVAGVSGFVWATALVIIPPLHMYKQLRGAYGLSRFGAWLRLFLLLIMTTIVIILFTLLLLVMGVLS